jgi:hypothetical protein
LGTALRALAHPTPAHSRGRTAQAWRIFADAILKKPGDVPENLDEL